MRAPSAETIIRLAFLFSWLPSAAFGATVKTVNIKKKTVTVERSEGEDEGSFEKEASVCVFDEDDNKIDCGTVSKISGATYTLKFTSARNLKKIKAKMTAKAEKTSANSPQVPSKKKTSGSLDPNASAQNRWRLWFDFSPALLTPAKFRQVSYAGFSSTPSQSMWTSGKTIKSATTGFSIRVGVPFGSSMSIISGLRYRIYRPSVVSADYEKNVLNPYTRSEQRSSAIGLFGDFEFKRHKLWKQLTAGYTGGLDIDRSTLSFQTQKRSDSSSANIANTSIAEATSTLTILSLRVGSSLDYLWVKSFGVGVGLNVIVPIVASKSFKGSIGEGEDKGFADPKKDLQKSLGHSKNTLAADCQISVTYTF